jgi:hypothetical protein
MDRGRLLPRPVQLQGRDSADSIATRYRLDGPGIEFWWGKDFPHPSRPVPGPTQPPLYNGYWVILGDKAAGAWP